MEAVSTELVVYNMWGVALLLLAVLECFSSKTKK
jgi:hypothetical protein